MRMYKPFAEVGAHGRIVRFIRTQEECYSLILTESFPVGTNAKIVTEPANAAKRICADYGIEYEHDMTRTQRYIP